MATVPERSPLSTTHLQPAYIHGNVHVVDITVKAGELWVGSVYGRTSLLLQIRVHVPGRDLAVVRGLHCRLRYAGEVARAPDPID